MSALHEPVEFRSFQPCPGCGVYAVHPLRAAPETDPDTDLPDGEDSYILNEYELRAYGGSMVRQEETTVYRADSTTCLSIRTCQTCGTEFPTF